MEIYTLLNPEKAYNSIHLQVKLKPVAKRAPRLPNTKRTDHRTILQHVGGSDVVELMDKTANGLKFGHSLRCDAKETTK